MSILDDEARYYRKDFSPKPAVPSDYYLLREKYYEIDTENANLKEAVKKQNEILMSITTPPLLRGIVLDIFTQTGDLNKGTKLALTSVGGQVIETALPKGTNIQPGDVVRVSPKTSTIVEKVGGYELFTGGVVATVSGKLANSVEIEMATMKKLVQVPSTMVPPEKGDRVLLDPAMSYVIHNLGKHEEAFTTKMDEIKVTWKDIGGQEKAKAEMIEAIEGPIKNRKIFEAYGKKATKGILLYGPPGCGKTMFAKAAATSLATMHGKNSSTGFIYVKGPEILSKWVGQSEETIRNLFARAREHFKKEGYPAVLFIDEADALLSSRGDGRIHGMEKTIVPMFLAEMDGLDSSGPLVLLATNRSDSLDPAVVRDGRIDRKIEVTRPTEKDSLEIFSMYLKGKPMYNTTAKDYRADFARQLFKSKLAKFVSGALIAGLVEQAISLAMRKDIDAGLTSATGLCTEDISIVILNVEQQNKDVQK